MDHTNMVKKQDSSMTPRKRVLLLIGIMTSIVIIVEAIAILTLYHTALNEEKARLQETAQSQAQLIEAIASFNKIYSNDYPYGYWQATLEQIKKAHENYKGFGDTGEFTLSTKENDQIVFLLDHRHYDLTNPKPVPWDSKLAQPMRLALSGKSGTVIALDYRGEKVLAAHEPISGLNLGIVAKIDMAEIQAPFIKAASTSALVAIIFIAIGVALFFRITNPVIDRLNATVIKLEKALEEVKKLRGILPICAYCKKIRDDKGYWNQVEVYMKEYLDTDFTHGICPDCMKKYFPEAHAELENSQHNFKTPNT